MASLSEIARTQTELDEPQQTHLHRFVVSWGLIADLCFSDLLLNVPTDAKGSHFVVAGQVRPTTNQTLYVRDLLGEIADEEERPLIARSYRRGEIIEGEVTDPIIRERVRMLCIPVRHKGETIAVLSRESTPSVGRAAGELERTYQEIFNRFARMIAAGEFPYAREDGDSEENLRVGDGCLVLDGSARVTYASPNAVSALHRIGIHVNTEGLRVGELGLDDEPVRTAFAVAAPVTEEIDPRPGVSVLLRCIPMVDAGRVTGAVLLLRDVTEIRRRDRLLLSKDATIREIHHRVKNNLQTISSLLRLQGRRLSSDEAKSAIGESVRRISSIALVHDILAREAGEDIPFVEVLRPLVRMVEESLNSPDREVGFSVHGDPGILPAGIATPMAVVLNELLQNTMDHAFPPAPDGSRPVGRVRVEMVNDGLELVTRVIDDGAGLPEGFSVAASTGLGLSIVRALVTSDLAGTIDMFEPVAGGGGTQVDLRVPLDAELPG
ncbi:sensor histidine kinase [Iamia sp.]|uniref:sensor histidine kinase n=1 Tax=Iamia sp. TaxID=2722710 RepID=UPI002BCEB4CE|nr:sensor histidine kinase [Iamia sp.]HXH55910.1 sensor histidine kinase [Iamia sp.]